MASGRGDGSAVALRAPDLRGDAGTHPVLGLSLESAAVGARSVRALVGLPADGGWIASLEAQGTRLRAQEAELAAQARVISRLETRLEALEKGSAISETREQLQRRGNARAHRLRVSRPR